MPRRSAEIVLIGVLALVFVSTNHAEDPVRGPLPPLPSMACPLIESDEAPTLDGNLDEAIWSDGDLQTRFYRYYFGLERPQEFRLLTDGQWLYIGFTAYEPQIAEKNHEYLTLAIAPHKTSDQFVGLSVYMTEQGIIKSNPVCDEAEDCTWQVAFRKYPDHWVTEIAIRTAPIFGDALSRGKVFDFNLTRGRMPILDDAPGIDIYQQWSNTGTSSGTRYRFGEVAVGRPSDRLPVIRAQLRQELEIARKQQEKLSDESRQAFSRIDRESEALLAASPGKAPLTTAAVKEYESQVAALERRLKRAALAERGVIVWACNPMTVPAPIDLPSADQQDATSLDIRVLRGEWESAALVVTNLANQTLDGQVLLTDFIAADGKTRAVGWDVLQVAILRE